MPAIASAPSHGIDGAVGAAPASAAATAGGTVSFARSQPMRLVLNPAVRVLWRARDVVQLELGADALLVEGADADTIRSLAPTAGAAAAVLPAAPVATAPRDLEAADAIDTLVDWGFVWRLPAHAVESRLRAPSPRLAPELTAMSSRYGRSAADLLHARRRAVVAVHGTGRAAAQVAALLAAAGVGRLHVVGGGAARLHHAVPGGICPADEGHQFVDAVRAAIDRAAPDVDTTPLPIGERPDLIVLAVDEPIETDQRDALHARRCSHLAVRLGPAHGLVGPLVIPGRTSCLRCGDLHRRDRDPAWTALAVQLSVPRRYGPVSDVALATVIAGVAAAEALAFLDGTDPATIDGTLEMHVPDWRLRRRSWPAHGDCGCGGGVVHP